MITRKIQYRNSCFLTVIPKTFAAILGLKPGDKISFDIEDKKIIIAPVPTAQS
ncbi:MAG TPA: AbrB/MazE/SpoVT family DNA-binding domain-containing protein [Candidatus Methylomirabilis sp.]|nr:AbrB/MazE/SpoVT family DNA-binding domain-containing protein [Candidatus Methylomirabilis sp.]